MGSQGEQGWRGHGTVITTMWVGTWAQSQMEASGSSPLRISDQVDRTMRIVAGGVVGPVANNDHNQVHLGAVGVNCSSVSSDASGPTGQHIGFIDAPACQVLMIV